MSEEQPPLKPGVQPGGAFFEPQVKGGEPGNLVPQADPGTGGSLPPVRPAGITPGKQFFGHPASGGVNTDPFPISITPNSDRTNGGEAFTITGLRFDNVNGATVTIGGVPATSVVVVSPTQITGVSPALSEGIYDVVVTNANGQFGTLVQAWTTIAAHIITISLVRGLTTGGTQLTITGVNFLAGSTVTFGGVAATGVIVVDSQHIYCVTPAHAVGVVDIEITDPGPGFAVATGANMFTYSDAVFGGDIRRSPSVTITDTLNNGRKTATFEIIGAGRNAGAPPVNKERVIFTDRGNLIFVGQVDTIVQTHEERPDNLFWKVTATDLTARFNRKRPFGTYVNTSATDIMKDLCARYVPEFDTSFIQSRLPKISLVLTGDLDISTIATQICQLIGEGHWYIDYSNAVHLFILPDALGNTNLVPPASTIIAPPGTAMTVSASTVNTLGYGWVEGYYYFQTVFLYGGSDATGPNAKQYDSLSDTGFSVMAGRANASGVFLNAGQGGFPNSPGQLPNQRTGAPIWLTLSRQAANRNLQGDISNGSYASTGRLFPRGWIGVDADGNIFSEGSWPAAGANAIYLASADVWTALEAASGGQGTPAVASFEGAPGPCSNIVYLNTFLPRFDNIPIGPTVGGRACTARKILFTRITTIHGAGGTPLSGYCIINDNTSTSAVPNPAYFSYSKPSGTVTPPVAPPGQINIADSGIAIVPGSFLQLTAQAGYWAVKVTGVYADGTESRSSDSSNVISISGLNSVVLNNAPTFPDVNGVPCVFRRIYASKAPGTTQVPDFDVSDTACVAVIIENTGTGPYTITFGDSLGGGQHSPFSIPPGEEELPGPDLEAATNPIPLTDGNSLTMNDPPPEVTSDTTQLKNRIYVKGKGTSIALDAAAGDTVINVMDTSTFSPTGGLYSLGSRVEPYQSLSATSGKGQLLLASPLTQAITQADWTTGGNQSILPFVQVDDVASQKYYGSLEVDANGNPTDGVHEFTITDATLTSQAQMINRAIAELKLFSRPIVTIRFSSRDPLMKAGKVIAVDMKSPPVKGNFVIQSVRIDQFRDMSNILAPRYNVFADSAARFTFNDLLLKLSEQVTQPADASMSGVIATAVEVVNNQQLQIPSTADIDCFATPSSGVNLQTNYSPVTFTCTRSGFATVTKTDSFGSWMSAAQNSNAGTNSYVHGNTSMLTLSKLFDITWRIRTPTITESDMLAFPAGGVHVNQVGNYMVALGITTGNAVPFPVNSGANRFIGFVFDQAVGQGVDVTRWNAVWVDEVGSNGVIHAVGMLPVERDAILICRMRVLSITDVNTGIIEFSMTNEVTGENTVQQLSITNSPARTYSPDGSVGSITGGTPVTVMWFNHMRIHIGVV